MYHSIKSIPELRAMERQQQQYILAISGTRLWKTAQRWKISGGRILFQGIFPFGGYFLSGFLLHDSLIRLGLLLLLVIVGAKIQYHFQITLLIPHIRDLVAIHADNNPAKP
ncbi:MAG: hypothetical protein RL748_800 [Pseudomonadota bacterium]|jgi:hypothetical protein